MLREPSDLGELIGASANGDRAAFADLYGRTAAKLLGVILRIVKDRGTAEDILQEVYLRVWQNASSFAPEAGRPMTWLISIARYRAIDVVRARRDVVVRAEPDGPDPLDLVADPRDREAEFAEMDVLRLCLDRLDEMHRRCFLDAYYEGYSREELSRRFNAPVNTIKTWLHRGAQSLRACLEET